MKTSLFLALFMISLPSFATFNEVECNVHSADQVVEVEVERAWPTGSAFKRATVIVTKDGAETRHDYTVTTRSWGVNTLRYWGAGMDLRVDLWPDQAPRWGRTYRAELNSRDVSDRDLRLDCRFPNAF